MTPRILATTSFAVLSAFLAAPAFADVTAEEVWQNWKDLGTAYGQTYTTGSETRAGDTLTITDLAMEMNSGDAKVAGTIPQVAFRETGDGRVEITLSDAYLMKMESKDVKGDTVSNSFNIGQNGLVMTASGDPSAISYDIKADSMVVNVLDFVADGKPKDLNVDFNLANLTANYQVTPGDMTGLTSTFAAQSLSFQVMGKGDDNKGSFEAKGQMNNLAGASAGAMPKAMTTGNLGAMLAGGFTSDGSFTYDNGNFTLAATDEKGSTTNVDSSSQGGSLNFSLDKSRIAYGANASKVAMKASGSAIPLPDLSAAYDEAAFSLLMPVAKSDEAQNFAIQTKLEGLTVSDMIWGMIDPAATLPRDAATLNISLKGKAKPMVDLLSVDKTAMMGRTPPVQLDALDVESLHLSVAGAEFKGDGALAFDNTKPPLLGGVAPMPTGKLNLSLTGANTLLGKLQALGLVDPQMTMTFGMMSGMLAKPGPTPDSLISEVEFQEGGKILTNGNPLPF
jgi:hypothetical protein